jgi:hypothetical protein
MIDSRTLDGVTAIRWFPQLLYRRKVSFIAIRPCRYFDLLIRSGTNDVAGELRAAS